MKTFRIILLTITVSVFAACKTTKKTTATSVTSTAPKKDSVTAVNIPSFTILPTTKPADGIYAPGNAEVGALQAQYKDVTLVKLTEGYTIYTKGACINCHGTVNIYQYDQATWKTIIDDMANRANINDAQKDAVYKYVLSIKATQNK